MINNTPLYIGAVIAWILVAIVVLWKSRQERRRWEQENLRRRVQAKMSAFHASRSERTLLMNRRDFYGGKQ